MPCLLIIFINVPLILMLVKYYQDFIMFTSHQFFFLHPSYIVDQSMSFFGYTVHFFLIFSNLPSLVNYHSAKTLSLYMENSILYQTDLVPNYWHIPEINMIYYYQCIHMKSTLKIILRRHFSMYHCKFYLRLFSHNSFLIIWVILQINFHTGWFLFNLSHELLQ